ncbi:MAG: hypothetical protein WA130_10140 [Candidatus Methanoperedens sp.]
MSKYIISSDRLLDKSTIHLYDLKKIDYEAYVKRLVIERFISYMGTPKPTEYSLNFVNGFSKQCEEIPCEKVSEIVLGIVKKNRHRLEIRK